MLEGEIVVGGAKNAVLPACAASILYETPLRLSRVPAIEDVARMSELLRELGVLVTSDRDVLSLDASTIKNAVLDRESAKKMRSSIFLIGPLLARLGEARFPHPGGCVIGERPIDQFIKGFEQMGASIAVDGPWYHLTAPKGLRGANIFFDLVSVSATETFMMAACLAEGVTVLENAAMEPEVVWLADVLVQGGARIHGAGTTSIRIEGGTFLKSSKVHEVMPDRIETGSFLILGALAAKNLTIGKCNPEHLKILIRLLQNAGVPVEYHEDELRIRNNVKPNSEFTVSREIRTHEYPGFATDVQAPLSVFLTQITGENTVFETIFENRLGYTEDLIKMGADITVWNPQKMMVKGPRTLRARELMSPDLRAGLAFIIAAITAKGESVVGNAYFIDRGYQNIEARLQAIGVVIQRVKG